MRETIIKLYQEGKSYREIESETGTNRGTIAYYLNPTIPKSRVVKRKQKRLQLKQRCILTKGGKCQACGFSKFSSALEFHHLDPSVKNDCISQLISRNQSYTTIKPELNKCILICANCHRGYHSGELTLTL